MWGEALVRCVGVHVRLQRCACVVLCGFGGLGAEFAVHGGCGKVFADASAYFVPFLVGGGKRVFQGWAEAHAQEKSVVPAGEGFLWPRGGVLLCVGACSNLCVGGGDRRDIGCGRCRWPAPLNQLGLAPGGNPPDLR